MCFTCNLHFQVDVQCTLRTKVLVNYILHIHVINTHGCSTHDSAYIGMACTIVGELPFQQLRARRGITLCKVYKSTPFWRQTDDLIYHSSHVSLIDTCTSQSLPINISTIIFIILSAMIHITYSAG